MACFAWAYPLSAFVSVGILRYKMTVDPIYYSGDFSPENIGLGTQKYYLVTKTAFLR
jgi:hypothetical protein